MPKTRPDDPLVSVVVPVLDEEGCVHELVRRVAAALSETGVRHEILFVDDGSRDGTAAAIAAARESDPRVKSIHFTRSFGHQAALVAGLERAVGDAVIAMDGDLQHPPEFLPTLIKAWREGADVVNTVRHAPRGARPDARDRAGRAFYWILNALTPPAVRPSGADFRLLDRRVVDAFNDLEEHFVFARGLIPWLGFDEVDYDYEVGERYSGRSKFHLMSMLRFALDGIFSFSVVPLRVIALLGLATTLFGIGFGIYSVFEYATGQIDSPGWTTLAILILVFGGVQLMSLGIVSEYVGRTYEEVKRRPRYVIDRTTGFD